MQTMGAGDAASRAGLERTLRAGYGVAAADERAGVAAESNSPARSECIGVTRSASAPPRRRRGVLRSLSHSRALHGAPPLLLLPAGARRRSHTLTQPSFAPAVTSVRPSGAYATPAIAPTSTRAPGREWSSNIVTTGRCGARVSQTKTLPSRLALASVYPPASPGEKHTLFTEPSCPFIVARHCCDETSQSRTEKSPDAVRSAQSSRPHAISNTALRCAAQRHRCALGNSIITPADPLCAVVDAQSVSTIDTTPFSSATARSRPVRGATPNSQQKGGHDPSPLVITSGRPNGSTRRIADCKRVRRWSLLMK